MSKVYKFAVGVMVVSLMMVSTVFAAGPNTDKVVKIIKIVDASESSDSVTTDAGDFLLRTTNSKYKKIKKFVKANKGKKIVLVLDADGEISDAKLNK